MTVTARLDTLLDADPAAEAIYLTRADWDAFNLEMGEQFGGFTLVAFSYRGAPIFSAETTGLGPLRRPVTQGNLFGAAA